MNSYFAVYLLGYVLVIAGIAYGMDAAGISETWIVVAVLILAGIGIIYAFGRSQTDQAQKMHAQGGRASSEERPPASERSEASDRSEAETPRREGRDPNQRTNS